MMLCFFQLGTNHLNEIAEIYQFIDLIILEYFSERHKNTEIEKNKLAEVYEIFEGCAYLSENRYVFFSAKKNAKI